MKQQKEEGLLSVYPLEDLGKTQSRGDKDGQFGDEKAPAVFYYLVKPFIHFSIPSDEMRCSLLSSCHSSVYFCPTGGCQWVGVMNIIDLLLQAQSMSPWLAPKKSKVRIQLARGPQKSASLFGNWKKKVSQTDRPRYVGSDGGQRSLSKR